MSLLHLRILSLTTILLIITIACESAAEEILSLAATPSIQATATSTPSIGEQLENLGRLYKNDHNNIVQELWILGRYHGQYHWSEGSIAEDDSYETRRFRLGTQARLFKKMTIHAQMVSGSNIDPFYNGFTELWTQWAFSPEFALTIGQQKHRFTHDRNVSSRYLNYLERSMLTNMFKIDYTPAVTLQGKIKDINYYTGFFSNATGTDMTEAFTDLDSGYSFLGAVYHELGQSLKTDTAFLHASYLHSDANQNATNMNVFENGLSSALILTKGSTSLVSEITAGIDSIYGNAVGINIQPGIFLTNKIQLVGRYQLANSNNATGLQPQRRYEQPAGLPTGDLYQATYFGVDYYIAKHRLKFMNGIEYSSLGGQDVWTASTMIRMYFGPHSGGSFPMNQMLPGEFFITD
jgi:hypothetical protein